MGDETFQADFFELKLVIHLGGSFNGGILEGHDGNPMFVGLRIFGFTPERSFFFEIFPNSGLNPDLFHQMFA